MSKLVDYDLVRRVESKTDGATVHDVNAVLRRYTYLCRAADEVAGLLDSFTRGALKPKELSEKAKQW